MYFLVRGSCGYVLPRFENNAYKIFTVGEHFGHVDFGDEYEFIDVSVTGKHVVLNKDSMIRRFTMQAMAYCELLSLSVRDLLKMKLEFPKYFDELFKDVK